MIADCEICDRKQVPCKSCQESQRAICYRCDGDVGDPYCELCPCGQKGMKMPLYDCGDRFGRMTRTQQKHVERIARQIARGLGHNDDVGMEWERYIAPAVIILNEKSEPIEARPEAGRLTEHRGTEAK